VIQYDAKHKAIALFIETNPDIRYSYLL